MQYLRNFCLGYESCEHCRAENKGPPGDKGKNEIVDINEFRKFVADQIVDEWQRYTDIDLDELKVCQIYGACNYKKSNKGNCSSILL